MTLDLSDDDEEIGEFIYRTSRTATLLREKKETEDKGDEENSKICSKRKRGVEVQETTCSIEGCSRKAADNGKCKREHGGWDYCSHEGCTNAVVKGGVCIAYLNL